MAIMFKKTLVFLFLFSHVLAASKPRGGRIIRKPGMSFSSVATRSSSRKKGSPLRISPTSVTDLSLDNLRPQTIQQTDLIQELDSFVLWGYESCPNDDKIDSEAKKPKLAIDEAEILLGAIIDNDTSKIRELISSEINMNEPSNFTGKTAFMHAIMSEDGDIVQLFLNTGKVDSNVLAEDGSSVFLLAMEHRFGMHLVRELLAQPIKLRENQALTILKNLVNSHSPYTNSLITAMAATGQEDINRALIYMTKVAIEKEDLDLLKHLHSSGIGLAHRFEGAELIHFAAVRNSREILKYLIEVVGVNIDSVTDKTELTALSISFLNKDYDVFFYLLQMGAKIDIPVCISFAIADNNLTLLQAFLSRYKGDFASIILPYGYNMLTFAMNLNCDSALNLIISSEKIDPNVADSAGRTIHNSRAAKNP